MPLASLDLTNHVAIVTGANHGIGAATASTLAECGASVLVTYLRLVEEDDSRRALPRRGRRARSRGEQLGPDRPIQPVEESQTERTRA